MALIGVRDDAGDAASIVFEVFAGDRKLYTSPPLTKYATPIGIDVRIPPKTKEIRLVTSGPSSEGHHWAGWANAGFQTRDDASRVALCHVACLRLRSVEVRSGRVHHQRQSHARHAPRRPGARAKSISSSSTAKGGPRTTPIGSRRRNMNPSPRNGCPAAGLVLETRRVDKSQPKACEDLSGLVKVWNEASQVDGPEFRRRRSPRFSGASAADRRPRTKPPRTAWPCIATPASSRPTAPASTSSRPPRPGAPTCSSMTGWSPVGPARTTPGAGFGEKNRGRSPCSRGSISWITSTTAPGARCSRWPLGSLRALSSSA